jgi:hypothetical protein
VEHSTGEKTTSATTKGVVVTANNCLGFFVVGYVCTSVVIELQCFLGFAKSVAFWTVSGFDSHLIAEAVRP